ncbi:Nitrogen permease regulator 2-like protein [Oopsacas minuta]|uniref:Nitrogen permease regulator 2-like protein n=1 Tax=Oopsacas minuta TaxID=111878 RepID=A0AAV7JNC0_9METZ|nr:Nitrogen permease regulator 2-like protein [Oopsacas minuta]
MTSTNSIIENFPIPSAILFLEFTSLGPTLLQQAPLGYLTDEHISRIRNFVFPPLSLFDRTLTLFHENRKYIGHAKCILGGQYKRNQYSFNCLLCFDGNLDVFPYHAVLTKIVNEFSIYEIEEAFFSSPYDSDNFQNILNAILHGLRTVGEVNLEITDCNWLFLKDLPTNTDTLLEPIDSKSVLVFQHNIRTISHTELDLTIAEVLSHMDEIRPLSSIAKDSDVSLKEIGIDVSRHLQYFNILQGFVPIFQYTNAYLISPRISLLLNSTEFQGEMLTYLRRDFDLQMMSAVKDVYLFENWSQSDLEEVVLEARLQEFPINKVVVRDSMECSLFYLVVEGKCRVLKEIDVDKLDQRPSMIGQSVNRHLHLSELQPSQYSQLQLSLSKDLISTRESVSRIDGIITRDGKAYLQLRQLARGDVFELTEIYKSHLAKTGARGSNLELNTQSLMLVSNGAKLLQITKSKFRSRASTSFLDTLNKYFLKLVEVIFIKVSEMKKMCQIILSVHPHPLIVPLSKLVS